MIIYPPIPNFQTLGTEVATALAKPARTLGSFQIYGDPMAPSAIILPDLTGVAPPLNAIGMAGGRLVVGDGVRVGGVPVVPTRYAGSAIIDFTGRPKATTWAKVMAIPLTGAEMAIGRKFHISGRITIHANAFGGGISGRTSIVAGWAGLAGSTGPWNGVEAGGVALTNWMPATIVPIFNGNRHDTLVYETGFQNEVVNSPQNALGLSEYGIRYGTQFFESNNYRSSFGTRPQLPPGVPAELCWMIQINTNGTGNHIGAQLFASWDLNLIFIN